MPVDTQSKEYLNFAEIKAEASVPVVLASLGLHDHFKCKDDELIGRCLIGEKHGKKDSFSFNTRKGAFQCFACKSRGSILDFVAKYKREGCTLRESAQFIHATMRHAHHLAGKGASEDDLVLAIAGEVSVAHKNEKRFTDDVETAKQQPTAPPDIPLKPADLQNAVMSWSLASYRVQDGKLDPDDLIVVDVATLEFLHQLTTPA